MKKKKKRRDDIDTCDICVDEEQKADRSRGCQRWRAEIERASRAIQRRLVTGETEFDPSLSPFRTPGLLSAGLPIKAGSWETEGESEGGVGDRIQNVCCQGPNDRRCLQ